jgi:hypothetical protein
MKPTVLSIITVLIQGQGNVNMIVCPYVCPFIRPFVCSFVFVSIVNLLSDLIIKGRYITDILLIMAIPRVMDHKRLK